MTQPRGDAKQWDGVVTKMLKVYGAPISEADAKAIVEYLSAASAPRAELGSGFDFQTIPLVGPQRGDLLGSQSLTPRRR